MKKIALAIAAGLLTTTGVASAGISLYQIAQSSDSNQTAAIAAHNDALAANCWFTGANNNNESGCSTSVADSLLSGTAGLPGLDAVTGLVNIDDLVGLATGAAADAQGVAAAGVSAASGINPLDCSLTAGLPISVPSLPVPGVASGVVGSVSNDLSNITGLAATTNSGSATAAGCTADANKLPVGNLLNGPAGNVTGTVGSVLSDPVGTVTGAVGGVLSDPVGTVTGAVGGVTGTAGGATDAVGGVTGAVGGVTGAVGGVTGAVGGVTGAVGGVTGAVGGVTGTVGGLVNNLPVPGLNCSASASSGILGSLTAGVAGTCP